MAWTRTHGPRLFRPHGGLLLFTPRDAAGFGKSTDNNSGLVRNFPVRRPFRRLSVPKRTLPRHLREPAGLLFA